MRASAAWVARRGVTATCTALLQMQNEFTDAVPADLRKCGRVALLFQPVVKAAQFLRVGAVCLRRLTICPEGEHIRLEQRFEGCFRLIHHFDPPVVPDRHLARPPSLISLAGGQDRLPS